MKTRTDLLKSLAQGSVGAELGVNVGDFSAVILRIVHPTLLWLVDYWDKIEGSSKKFTAIGRRTAMRRTLGRFNAECACGIVRPLALKTEVAVQWVEDGSLDWLFVDADHSKAGCMQDLRDWFCKVRAGGTIMVHDYHYAWKRCGVVPAVTEFARKHRVSRVQVTTGEKYPTAWFTKG